MARWGRRCNPAPGPRGPGEARLEPNPCPSGLGRAGPHPVPGQTTGTCASLPTPAQVPPAGGAFVRRLSFAGSGLSLGSPVTLKVRPGKMVSRPSGGSASSSNIDAAPDCPSAPRGGAGAPAPNSFGMGQAAGKGLPAVHRHGHIGTFQPPHLRTTPPALKALLNHT